MSHSTSNQRRRVPSSAYKVLAFTVVTVILIGVLATLIGNISFAPSRTYYALFTDATGVNPGDRVRLSGVEVGSVKSLELVPAGEHQLARVEFTVEDDVPIFQDAQLELRYENIVGQRYLAIKESPGSGATMVERGVFPTAQTTPALNLTVLFNGFQPLFRALDPEQVNKLSYEMVRAFQGDAGTFQSLLHDTAQLTNAIADKDAVIGQVVDNLNTVLATVGHRDQGLTSLIVQFRRLMTGLAGDRDTIDTSLTSLAGLLTGTSDFVEQVRAPFRADVRALDALAGHLSSTRGELDASLKGLPPKLRAIARTASYGSWFNFYVCGVQIRLSILGGTTLLTTPTLASNERDTSCAGGGQ